MYRGTLLLIPWIITITKASRSQRWKASSRRATVSAKCRQTKPINNMRALWGRELKPDRASFCHDLKPSHVHCEHKVQLCNHLPKQDEEALKDWKGTLKWSEAEGAALSVTKKIRTLLVWSGEAYRRTEWGFRSQRAGWGATILVWPSRALL